MASGFKFSLFSSSSSAAIGGASVGGYSGFAPLNSGSPFGWGFGLSGWNNFNPSTGSSTPSAPQVGPQGVDIAKQVAEDGSLSFVGSDFAVSDGTALDSFKVTAVPTSGTLKLSGVEVATNQVIDVADFANLTYEPDADFDGVETFSIAMSTDGTVFDSSNSSVTITVLANDNDAPAIDAVPTVAVEEGAQATNIGSLIVASFNDPDSSDSLGQVVINAPLPTNGDLSYTSAAGGVVTLAGAATITAAEAATLKFTADADNGAGEGAAVTASLSFDLIDSNGDQSASSGSMSIQIADGNDAPTFSSAPPVVTSFTVNENLTTLAGALLNPGRDNETEATLRYSLTGTDASLFTVDSANGSMSFKNPADHEDPKDSNKDNIYSFNLVVTDDGGKTASTGVTVTVTDLDNPPSVTSGPANTINEGTSVAYTAAATDSDAGDTSTFSITGGADASLFSIDPTSGVVTFDSTPDRENPADTDSNSTYVIEVTATDLDGFTDSQTVTITVDGIDDENPSPTPASTVIGVVSAPATLVSGAVGSAEINVAETVVGPIFDLGFGDGEHDGAVDTDVTYALTASALAGLSITASGVVSVAASSIDHETQPTFSFGVKITDADGATAVTSIKVNVTDVNDAPEFTDPVFEVQEDASDRAIGTALANGIDDPDGDDVTITFTAVPNGTTEGVLFYEIAGVNNAWAPVVTGTAYTPDEYASIEYFGPAGTGVPVGTDPGSSILGSTSVPITFTMDDGSGPGAPTTATMVIVNDPLIP